MTAVFPQQRTAFYRAALIGLRALDSLERTPRRFGPAVDARWTAFSGHLGIADRIDLLIRDAAVTWGSGFSPAQVFQLPGLATDEPFGPDWGAPPEHESKSLWASVPDPGIAAVVAALGLTTQPVQLPTVGPATRLVVAGASALVATAGLFAQRDDLSWSDQVLVVAQQPATRQLAGLIAPLVGAREPTKLTAPADDARATLRRLGVTPGGAAVVSSDASTGCQAFVRQATQGA